MTPPPPSQCQGEGDPAQYRTKAANQNGAGSSPRSQAKGPSFAAPGSPPWPTLPCPAHPTGRPPRWVHATERGGSRLMGLDILPGDSRCGLKRVRDPQMWPELEGGAWCGQDGSDARGSVGRGALPSRVLLGGQKATDLSSPAPRTHRDGGTSPWLPQPRSLHPTGSFTMQQYKVFALGLCRC